MRVKDIQRRNSNPASDRIQQQRDILGAVDREGPDLSPFVQLWRAASAIAENPPLYLGLPLISQASIQELVDGGVFQELTVRCKIADFSHKACTISFIACLSLSYLEGLKKHFMHAHGLGLTTSCGSTNGLRDRASIASFVHVRNTPKDEKVLGGEATISTSPGAGAYGTGGAKHVVGAGPEGDCCSSSSTWENGGIEGTARHKNSPRLLVTPRLLLRIA